ncbi:MAG: hypothetical protein ACK40G_03210 [Cytophagaceae bacterium]
MAVIKIELDVINSQQIVETKKGTVAGVLADVLISNKKLKRKIEKKIAVKLASQLKDKIQEGLEKEGVNANLKFSVILREEVVL